MCVRVRIYFVVAVSYVFSYVSQDGDDEDEENSYGDSDEYLLNNLGNIAHVH